MARGTLAFASLHPLGALWACAMSATLFGQIESSKMAHFPQQPDLPCPTDGSSLRNSPAHWANRAEASAAGWEDAVLGETEAIG